MNRSITVLALALAVVLGSCAVQKADTPNEVLVVGATGQTGQRIVQQLLGKDYKVRVYVRDEQKARGLFGDRVDYLEGDVQNSAGLVAVTFGVSAVISAVGSNGKGENSTPEKVDYEGVMNMVDAARQARVEQFVLISSMAVTHEDHVLNRIADNILIWKFKGENYLRNSGLAYTVVRAGGLTDKQGGQNEIVFEQGDAEIKVVQIPRDDVARVCVEALTYPDSKFKTLEVFTNKEPAINDWQTKFAALEKG